jgi:hypothetical protein
MLNATSDVVAAAYNQEPGVIVSSAVAVSGRVAPLIGVGLFSYFSQYANEDQAHTGDYNMSHFEF